MSARIPVFGVIAADLARMLNELGTGPGSRHANDGRPPITEGSMKSDIHPAYEETTGFGCGNTFQTRTQAGGRIVVEVCSQCHPFYTALTAAAGWLASRSGTAQGRS